MPNDKPVTTKSLWTLLAEGVHMSNEEWLRSNGHTVEKQDISGLYRIDGGPEVTASQLSNIVYNMRNP